LVGSLKTFKNRIFILAILIVAMSLVIFAPPPDDNKVYADGAVRARMHADDQTVHRGQTFDVDINLSDNEGILTLFLTLKFDHRIFTLTNVQQVRESLGSLNLEHSGSGYDYVDDKTGGFNLFWDGSVMDKTNGTIVKLTFSSSLTAPLGTYPIDIVVDKKNTTSAYNVEANVEVKSPMITLTTGAFIVVWHDWDGSPIRNTNITGHPYNAQTGGYEYAEEDGLNVETDFPNAPTRQADSMYSYEFAGFKGAVWHGDAPQGTSVIYYVADYMATPQKYVVWYYVDGFGEDNSPDDEITDDELYTAKETAYGENIDESVLPYKHNYTFYGWYRDRNFTQKLTTPLMPAEDVKLYGYFKYNIREDNIPEIQLKYRETVTDENGDSIAYVDVYIIKNYGLSSLMIGVGEYDKTISTFCGFERGEIFRQMSFYTTNHEGDEYPDDFMFSWNNSYVNSYETGRLLILKFRMNKTADDGAYEVQMTANNVNTTYVTGGEIWYSDVKFIDTKIPIGTRDSWTEPIPDSDKQVEIVSNENVPYNIELVIKDITNEARKYIDETSLEEVLQERQTLYYIYDIYFVMDSTRLSQEDFLRYFGEEDVTVRIRLTLLEQKSKTLTLYYVDQSGQMNLHDSQVEDGYLIFKTNHFSNWALVGDQTVEIAESASSILMKFMLLFWGISTSALLAIVFARARKKQPLFVYSDKKKS